MIKLNRKKGPLKILEIRYPYKLSTDFNFDVIKIYSFKDIIDPSWNKHKIKTMEINLNESENELYQNIKKKYRKHIKTEENRGIVIKKSSTYFDKFYDNLYLNLCKDRKMTPYPRKYLLQGDLWVSLSKEGNILSGSIIFHDSIYATQSFTASNHTEYNGNRLLIWEAIKYYKNHKLKYFNFGGGESDYKRRFGSTSKELYLYTRYLSRKSNLLNAIRNLKRLFFPAPSS